MAPSHGLASRRAFQFLIYVVGIASICLVAVQPFMLDRMPRTDDGLLQMYRSVTLAHSLRVDHPLWPRYSSGLVYGYGAPLFNYFPPLSYFPASWLHGVGFSFVGSWLLSMVIYTLLAALGMFLLARLWTRSDLGGWMAALAYVYAPFFLFDSLTRGSSSELAALAALPFVMPRFHAAGKVRPTPRPRPGGRDICAFHSLAHLDHATWDGAAGALLPLPGLARGERRAVFIRLSLAGLLG